MPTVLPISAWASGDDACRYYNATGLVTDRHRLVNASRHRAHCRLGHLRGQHWTVGGAGQFGVIDVGRAEQQAKVGGVNRRGVNPHQNLIFLGLGHWYLRQRHFEFARRFEQRYKLQSGLGDIGHKALLKFICYPDRYRIGTHHHSEF